MASSASSASSAPTRDQKYIELLLRQRELSLALNDKNEECNRVQTMLLNTCRYLRDTVAYCVENTNDYNDHGTEIAAVQQRLYRLMYRYECNIYYNEGLSRFELEQIKRNCHQEAYRILELQINEEYLKQQNIAMEIDIQTLSQTRDELTKEVEDLEAECENLKVGVHMVDVEMFTGGFTKQCNTCESNKEDGLPVKCFV